MKKSFLIFDKIGDCIAKAFMTKPLASFSVIGFMFIIMRLYMNVQPLLLFVFFVGLVLIWLKIAGKINSFIMVFILCATFLGIYSATYHINRNNYAIDMLNNSHVRIVGTISSVVDENGTTKDFYINAEKIYSSKGTYDNKLKLYAKCSDNCELQFGDKITVNAYLKQANSNIALSQYHLSKGAPLVAYDIILIEVNETEFPHNIIPSVRNYMISVGDELFANEAGMLFKALVAGDKSTFSDELRDNLSASGLSHIAAVSGLHVSLLGMTVFNLLKRRNKFLSLIVCIVLVLLFAFVTGTSPSTVRATIMFLCYITAKMLVRENDGFTALCFSAMIIAVFNAYVIYDWGFILSFLSVLGIQVFSVYFKNLLKFLPEYLADSIAITLSAQIMTVPALTIMFGYVSVYSIAANIIISVVFIPALYLCIISAFIAVIPLVNYFIPLITAFFLEIIVVVAELFANMPHSVAYLDSFDSYECIAYYTIVLLFVFRNRMSKYLISLILVLCAITIIFGSYSDKYVIKKYEICENSVLIVKGNQRILTVNDDMHDVYLSLKEWGRCDKIDSLIVNCDVVSPRYSLKNIKEFTDAAMICVPYDDYNNDYVLEAKKLGMRVEYYFTDEDEYAESLLK